MSDGKRLLSANEAGRLVRRTGRTVRLWATAGVTVGGRRLVLRAADCSGPRGWLFTRKALKEFLAACREARGLNTAPPIVRTESEEQIARRDDEIERRLIERYGPLPTV